MTLINGVAGSLLVKIALTYDNSQLQTNPQKLLFQVTNSDS